jgi:para-nitrobenzyl esterase
MTDPIDRRGLLAGAAASLSLAASPSFARPHNDTGVGTGVGARTTAGRIRGFRDGDVAVFKGVPYGADTAQTRFAPPKPPRPWREARPCLTFGAPAPQGGGDPGAGYLPEGTAWTQAQTSEDCLNLNVWTPATDGAKRPVLVWFHGGGFSGWSVNSPLYDGANLAKRGDVVVVTVNHRLNSFGYLYLAEPGGERFADSGNAGMLDLVLALQWIRDNIEGLGGDPGRVTLFGQSGGGAKASVLMGMPAARGLFHRVMTMSGQQVTVVPPEMATTAAHKFLTNAGAATPDALLRMTKDQLIAAGRGVSTAPVLDGRSLLRDPFEPDATPLARDVALIMGNTHDETRYLIGLDDPALFDLTWDQLLPALKHSISNFFGPLSPEATLAWYRDKHPGYSPSQIFFAMTTELRSWRAQVIQADRRAVQPGANTWVYQFDWQSPVAGGRMGAPHCGDIPFMFRNHREMTTMTGGGPETEVVADAMSSALVNFARTGDPNGAGVPDWPKYELPGRMTMQWNTVSKANPDPRGEERRLLGLIPYRQPGT